MNLERFFSLVTDMQVEKKSLFGVVQPEKDEDISDLREWSENSAEFEFNENNGQFSFTLKPMLENGLGYASYFAYFDTRDEWWKKTIKLDQIVEHRWLKFKQCENCIDEKKLSEIVYLLNLLSDKQRFYSDKNSVVFFSKKPFRLLLRASNIYRFIKIIQQLSSKQLDAIDDLCKWLKGNAENEHFHAKKNAFSSALTDFLTEKKGDEQHDICDLLEYIINIKNQAFIQYELYLEDFSYSKFVKKIEENSTQFISRINDVLNKSVTQILGLPIATVIFNFAKIENHWISIFSLIIYIIICSYVLYIQQHNLSYIANDIDLFEKNLPKQLKNEQWKLSRQVMSEQINRQKYLTKFLWAVIVLTFWYISFKIGYLLRSEQIF